MKKLLFILPALFFSLIFTTCEKNPIPDPNDFYFRSKINGKLYIPNGCANCMSGMLLGDTTFLMNGNAGYESIAIGIINVTGQPITTMSYFLNDNRRHGADYKNSTITDDIFNTDANRTGRLNIKSLDKTSRIITGTFYFKAYNSIRNDSVSITDGTFRLKYTIN